MVRSLRAVFDAMEQFELAAGLAGVGAGPEYTADTAVGYHGLAKDGEEGFERRKGRGHNGELQCGGGVDGGYYTRLVEVVVVARGKIVEARDDDG